uniref:Uncharacterized protein n=1 Tax=Arundo donax TaxID=35708 RepID=A0A0A9HRD5_ARUDO
MPMAMQTTCVVKISVKILPPELIVTAEAAVSNQT